MHETKAPALQEQSVRAVVACVLLCFLFFFLVTPAYAAPDAGISNSFGPIYSVMFKTVTPLATLALCFAAMRVLTHDPQNVRIYAAAKRAVLVIVVAYAAFCMLPLVASLFNDLFKSLAWDPNSPGQ